MRLKYHGLENTVHSILRFSSEEVDPFRTMQLTLKIQLIEVLNSWDIRYTSAALEKSRAALSFSEV
jgi:hypothetical protein